MTCVMSLYCATQLRLDKLYTYLIPKMQYMSIHQMV